MNLVKWEPFKDLLRLQSGFGRWFDDPFKGIRESDGNLELTAWSPAVDIYETPNELVLKAELPGIDQKSIDVHVENNTLALRGERKLEKETKEENYHRVERSYGSFYRSFSLPSTVDQEKIHADYKEGVLTLTLPKREETKPKQIKVAVA